MYDMFFEQYECDVANYADDNTPHTYDSDLYTVLSKLKHCTDSLFTFFKGNHMKPNGDKYHRLVTTENQLVSTLTETMQKIRRNKNYSV